MSKAIINYANGKWYPQGQLRLSQSIEDDDISLLFWTDLPPGLEEWQRDPYVFKLLMFRAAQAAGHRYVLWLDASVWAVKSVQPIFHHIKANGTLFVEDGNLLGHWSTDDLLEYAQLSREQAMDYIIPVGACIGLDLEHRQAKDFLDLWECYARARMFKGAHKNINGSCSDHPDCRGHRHDIAVGAIILKNLGIPLLKPPTFYWVVQDNLPESVCVVAQGM